MHGCFSPPDDAQMAALVRWYVVEADYKQATLALSSMISAGFVAYLAQETKLARPRVCGRQASAFIQIFAPIFNPYVFVSFAPDGYAPLLRCRGVKRLICGAGGVPKPVARGEVERLIAEEPERHQNRLPRGKAPKPQWVDWSEAEIRLRRVVR
jgi:hypothetical protein